MLEGFSSHFFDRRIHSIAQGLLSEKASDAQVFGIENIDPNAPTVLLLYNHCTRLDTAALAYTSTLAGRSLHNLVRPGSGWKASIKQKINPTSHYIYTPDSITDPQLRHHKNILSLQHLRANTLQMGLSSVSLAPDGGTSTPYILPENVKTRGIQMLVDVFGSELDIYPIGLSYNQRLSTIQVGQSIKDTVMNAVQLIGLYNDDLAAIREINSDLKNGVANSINQLIRTDLYL